MKPEDARDFREETLLTAAEESLLKEFAGDLGLSKSATLRFCLLQLGSKHMRNKHLQATGLLTD